MQGRCIENKNKLKKMLKLHKSLYLRFQGVADEEYHHTGIQFVFRTPSIPGRYRLAQIAPNIERRHNCDNQYQFKE